MLTSNDDRGYMSCSETAEGASTGELGAAEIGGAAFSPGNIIATAGSNAQTPVAINLLKNIFTSPNFRTLPTSDFRTRTLDISCTAARAIIFAILMLGC